MRARAWVAAVAIVVLATTAAARPAAAAPGPADDQSSFVGCPLLLEGQRDDVCVWQLQHYLNVIDPDYALPEDGNFGPLTRTAVLDFQADSGLPADGNVGAATARLLEQRAGIDPNVGIGLAPTDDPATEGGGDMSSNVLAEQCPEQFASLDEYLSGQVDAPRCFPYYPLENDSPLGSRAEDPYTDGCSGPTHDNNFLWDRRQACATHDYAYDLLRYGVDTFAEHDADNWFVADMVAECRERHWYPTLRDRCIEQAYGWRAFVRLGDVSPGDAITDSYS